MLVWPRQRCLGPRRLPDELWHMIAVEFVLPACAFNNAIGSPQPEPFSSDSDSEDDSEDISDSDWLNDA